MDTLQVITLIIIALILLAVVIRYRRKIAVALEIFGLKLNVQAEDRAESATTRQKPAAPSSPSQAAGVRVEDLKSGKGIMIEQGVAHDPKGVGIEAKKLTADEDIIIGPGQSGDPKAQPPA